MKTSKELHDHYLNSRPIIVESMNSMVEKNYEKIMEIWNETKNPVPIKRARKLNVSGRDYYYIISLYIGSTKNLEWDALMYTFDSSSPDNDSSKFNKDLIYFSAPDFKVPFPGLNGTLRFTAKFLEMYGYMYGPNMSLYDVSERWVRRNSCPLFVVTSDPLGEDNPSGCNVIGKDFDGNGVCIARVGEEDSELVKFMSFYPEDVLEELNKRDSSDSISTLLNTFREFVKPVSYKNTNNRTWPDKFMLNEYYE